MNVSGQACCMYPFMWAKKTKRYSWGGWVPHISPSSLLCTRKLFLMLFRVNHFCKTVTPLLACWFLKTKVSKVLRGQLSPVLQWDSCCVSWWVHVPFESKGFSSCRAQSCGDRNLQNTLVNHWAYQFYFCHLVPDPCVLPDGNMVP